VFNVRSINIDSNVSFDDVHISLLTLNAKVFVKSATISAGENNNKGVGDGELGSGKEYVGEGGSNNEREGKGKIGARKKEKAMVKAEEIK
jgi:hypothetical protein